MPRVPAYLFLNPWMPLLLMPLLLPLLLPNSGLLLPLLLSTSA